MMYVYPLRFPTITSLVKIIPILKENYSYIIKDDFNQILIFVDPGDPIKLINYSEKQFPNFKLKAVLITHKHIENSGGSL